LRAGNYLSFGLRIAGILQIFHSQAVLQRIVVDFPAFFGDRFDGRDGDLCTYNPTAEEVRSRNIGGIFVLSGSELRTLIKNSR
jgi:hypothetical protein